MQIGRFFSKIKAMIKRIEKASISKEDLKKYVQEINLSQKAFPVKEQREAIVALLKAWDELSGAQKIVLLSRDFGEKFPKLKVYGVISHDWPGLADTTMGLFHEKGWNIYFIKAFSMEHRGEDLGVILIAIRVESPESMEKLRRDEEDILKNIEYVITGSLSKQSLIAEEIKKLKIYGKITEEIRKIYQGPYLKEIIEEEAVKFVAARSREYLEERRIEDLARLIIDNRILAGRVLEEDKPQVRIRDLPTKRGVFTAITAFDRMENLSMEDLVRIIWHIYPDHRIMFYKEYKRKGVTVAHVEVVDETGNPLPPGIKAKLEEFLSNPFLIKQARRAGRIQRIGGFEHYARAIIPVLVREAQNTGLPQVFFSVVGSDEFYIHFKLIIVNKTEVTHRIIEELQGLKGVEIRAAKIPKEMGNWFHTVIDIRVALEYFSSVEEIYNKLKTTLEGIIGRFRDFDKGMREMEKTKFYHLSATLKEIPEKILREFYFNLEDFYRIGASQKELEELLRMGWDCYSSEGVPCFRIGKVNSSMLLVLKVPPDPRILPELAEAFYSCTPIISRSEFGEWDIIFLSLRECEDEDKVRRKLLELLNKGKT